MCPALRGFSACVRAVPCTRRHSIVLTDLTFWKIVLQY